jgi:hypothetical protein
MKRIDLLKINSFESKIDIAAIGILIQKCYVPLKKITIR